MLSLSFSFFIKMWNRETPIKSQEEHEKEAIVPGISVNPQKERKQGNG